MNNGPLLWRSPEDMSDFYPFPVAFNSRGSSPQQDYSWSGDGTATPLLAFAPQNGSGLLIGITTGQPCFSLMLCNLDAARTDFRQRRIRTTVVWDGLDEPQARTLAIHALQNWSELERVVQQTVVVTADEPCGWKVFPDTLAKWLQTLPAPDAPTSSVHQRLWRASGPPGSPAWQEAIKYIGSAHLPPVPLAFVLSPDPNPAVSEKLKREAACLLTDGGPETWQELTTQPAESTRLTKEGAGGAKQVAEAIIEKVKPVLTKGLETGAKLMKSAADSIRPKRDMKPLPATPADSKAEVPQPKNITTSSALRSFVPLILIFTSIYAIGHCVGWMHRNVSAKRQLNAINKAREQEHADYEKRLAAAKKSSSHSEQASSSKPAANK